MPDSLCCPEQPRGFLMTTGGAGGAPVTAFRAAFRATLSDPEHGLANHLTEAFDHLEHGLPG